ncbi:hypothetical protein [Bartonella sp. HY761]|uniref:hypothetical protein n=1 Tax=Bartonella sp. HY761 TaxID=2979330 RepID=UPI0021FDAD01|nr:hypothetical protein [Bartonella sp. HY761]UXN05844.1 hypothetical protein N6A79_11170 [Bartonella sp. HY761]
MFFKKLIYTLGIISCGVIISSCGARKDYSVTEITNFTNSQASRATVRVFAYERECLAGSIRVRQLIDGKIDYRQFTILSSSGRHYGVVGLTDKTKRMATFPDFGSKKASLEKLNAKDIIDSFTVLKPGRYVITEVKCFTNGQHSEWIGETEKTFFGTKTAEVIKPVLGANYFELKENEWLDLGSIELKGFEVSYRQYIGMSLPYPANEKLKEILNTRFPNLAKNITFGTARAMPLSVLSQLDNRASGH